MIVYISHKYQGEENNKREVEEIVCGLAERYPQHTFISAIHAFGFLYDKVIYDQGLHYCLELLGNCDLMIVTGENWKESEGVNLELQYSISSGMQFLVNPDIELLDMCLGD